jgi:dihydrodipicolinate synthase/N-acetylneuraminate lyase
MSFRGVIPILQTPFREDGSFDEKSLAALVEWCIAQGVDGVAWPGFVSEWWKLTSAEILAGAKVIASAARGKTQAILNVTAQSTHAAVEQAREFTRLGASGLMVLPPFVMQPGAARVLAHLEEVLAASPLPHILQYSAGITGLNLSMAALAELRLRHPHLVCIKVDFVPPGPMVSELAGEFADTPMTYLIGYAGVQLPDCLRRGAHGLMGGAGHLAPDVSVFRQLLSGGGLEAFHRLLPLLNFEMQSIDQSTATHKYLLAKRGVIASGHVRRPGPELDAMQREECAALYALAETAIAAGGESS